MEKRCWTEERCCIVACPNAGVKDGMAWHGMAWRVRNLDATEFLILSPSQSFVARRSVTKKRKINCSCPPSSLARSAAHKFCRVLRNGDSDPFNYQQILTLAFIIILFILILHDYIFDRLI